MLQTVPRTNEGIASKMTMPYKILLLVKSQILQQAEIIYDHASISVYLPMP